MISIYIPCAMNGFQFGMSMVYIHSPFTLNSCFSILVSEPLGFHHCTICSGTVHASQTKSIGASKTLLICTEDDTRHQLCPLILPFILYKANPTSKIIIPKISIFITFLNSGLISPFTNCIRMINEIILIEPIQTANE